MAEQIVKPGEEISPKITLSEAVTLAEHLYGLTVSDAKQMDGYDDRNYHLKVTVPPNNKYITSLWPHGYVLKIMNSSDSKKLDCVEAQCEVMIFLGNHEIKTPQPQKSRDGRLFCLQDLPLEKNNEETKTHAIRLLTFIEGKMLIDIPWSFTLHYEVGKYTAQIDLVLQNFSHTAYDSYSSLWMLKNVSEIRKYLKVFEEADKRIKLVQDVVQHFEDKVLRNFTNLKAGMIHGDIHDQNLLCHHDGDGGWCISGVLDLGDSHHSAYVVELALAMAYMMLQSGHIESGTHVLAGYCSIHPLPLEQLQLLKVCVSARLCQSLVLGLYTYSLNPSNHYVLSTQPRGWDLLERIWMTDSVTLEQQWFSLLPEEYSAMN